MHGNDFTMIAANGFASNFNYSALFDIKMVPTATYDLTCYGYTITHMIQKKA